MPAELKFVQTKADKPLLYSALLFFLGVCLFSAGNPFFWDNILNARIATEYLRSGFSTLIPPAQLDAGHPPGFNLYLALVWKVMGRSVPVSHLAMLPFLWAITFHYWRLVCRCIPPRGRLVAMLLLVLEPTVLAQSTQVSPDIALVACILASVNFILEGKKVRLMLTLCVLSMLSMRGILILPGLFLLDVLISAPPRISLRRIWPYLPAGLLVLSWWLVHYRSAGWAVSPPDETYGTHREAAGAMGMLRNLAVMGWRFLDQGRILLWGMIAVLLLAKVSRKAEAAFKLRPLILIFAVLTGTWMVIFVPLSNPIGHRYWMLSFLLGALIVSWLLSCIERKTVRSIAAGMLALAFVSGHFWLYPEPIAKGWDSTLAHVSWFEAQKEMDDYITAAGIREEVCTDFPNVVSRSVSTLDDSLSGRKDLKNFSETGLETCTYVVQSNIMNGFEAGDLTTLQSHYRTEKEIRSGFVFIRLWHRVD